MSDRFQATITNEDGETESFLGFENVGMTNKFITYLWADGQAISLRLNDVKRMEVYPMGDLNDVTQAN